MRLREMNLSDAERTLRMFAGWVTGLTGLVLLGVAGGGALLVAGVATSVGGWVLFATGYAGRCPVSRRLGRTSRRPPAPRPHVSLRRPYGLRMPVQRTTRMNREPSLPTVAATSARRSETTMKATASLRRPLTARPPEPLRVEHVMSDGLIACDGSAPLAAVAAIMARERVHCVLVETGEGGWSVLSDLDLVAASGGPADCIAADAAASEVVAVEPGESLERAAQLMTEHAISHLVVVPRTGRPIGVVSTLDVAVALAEDDDA